MMIQTMKLPIQKRWTGLPILALVHSRIVVAVLFKLRMVPELAEAELREQATGQASTMYSHLHPEPDPGSPRP
jgi:hypothetical protein